MKFLDLNTGYSFDGIWKNNQTSGYIFWFPKEQSVDLTYAMPICILTETSDPLHIKIENNNIFKFITHDNVMDCIDGYVFNEPIYSLECITNPESVGKYYCHIINISCSSELSGEYICNVYLNDDSYIKIGADFYDENESLTINLSNMGVELPDGIQKAFYHTDVHEDFRDNIVLNRKFKELLSNYWDVIANKGSYKSLINSLKWFEWDDKLKIKEIYKHNIEGISHFSDKDIVSILEDKINVSYENFIKTTYISLYYLTYEETVENISGLQEQNPILKNIENTVLNWSKNDLRLKLSLLAKYFGNFFLPIHLSIFHATVEDAIFTNTIKAINGQIITRTDSFGSFDTIECNIPENAKYALSNVSAQVTNDTLFGIKYDSVNNNSYDSISFGVDEFKKPGMVEDNDSIKTFSQQYFSGLGVIVPIKLRIPNIVKNDFVKHTIVNLSINGKEVKHEFRNVIESKPNRYIDINFNFLAKEIGEYELRMSFILGSSKTYVKTIKFLVEDVDNIDINVYKIKSKDDSNGFTYDDFKDNTVGNYIFKLQSNTKDSVSNIISKYFLSYMPSNNVGYDSYDGVKLNRIIIAEVKKEDDSLDLHKELSVDDYLFFYRGGTTCNYLFWLSKKFNADSPTNILKNEKITIIKNELTFYPQFHKLELLNGDNLNDYTISQYDSLCCSLSINNNDNCERWIRGNYLNDIEWSFVNTSINKKYENISSSIQPIIGDNKGVISDGYYDIIFRCKTNNTREFIRSSAFRKKSV